MERTPLYPCTAPKWNKFGSMEKNMRRENGDIMTSTLEKHKKTGMINLIGADNN